MAVTTKSNLAWIVVDDSIKFIEDITIKQDTYTSIFENPVLKFYKKMHDSYGAVFLLPMFFTTGYDLSTGLSTGWNLTQATDKFKAEFQANSSWLKMSFHSYAGRVRYRSGFNTRTAQYDYSRNLVTDWATMKAEVVRFAGVECWNNNTTFHFGDCRKSEIDALPEINLIGANPWEARHRGEVGYLNPEQQEQYFYSGYYYDNSNKVLHALRPFEIERIAGSLKLSGMPNKAIDYLDSFNHRIKSFMNIGTHEVQIINGINKAYPVKKDIQDFCSWAKMRGYEWKFPQSTDFNV